MCSSRVLACSFLQNLWGFFGAKWRIVSLHNILQSFPHKTVLRCSVKMVDGNHLCRCFGGVFLSYFSFSNQVFRSMLPVQIFSVLYVRFWISLALTCRVLPLSRIIASAWIFSITSPLPGFIPPAVWECFKTPGHPNSLWEAAVLCSNSAPPGAFFPLWLSYTIVSLATVSQFWVFINATIDHNKELEAIFSLAYTSGSVWRVTASSKQLPWIPQIQLIYLSQSLFVGASGHRIPFFPVWWRMGLHRSPSCSCLPGFLVCDNLFKLVSEGCPTDGSSAWREGCTHCCFKTVGATFSILLKTPRIRRQISNWNKGYSGDGSRGSNFHSLIKAESALLWSLCWVLQSQNFTGWSQCQKRKLSISFRKRILALRASEKEPGTSEGKLLEQLLSSQKTQTNEKTPNQPSCFASQPLGFSISLLKVDLLLQMLSWSRVSTYHHQNTFQFYFMGMDLISPF